MTPRKWRSALHTAVCELMNTPEPLPCRRKYARVNAADFVRHIDEDKCPKCLAVARYLERESERAMMTKELWKNRN